MHIHQLIQNISSQIPFQSEQAAQQFLNSLAKEDRIALITAMYIGRTHIHLDEINEDHLEKLRSGEIDRFWDADSVQDNEIARVLHEKNINLKSYLDAFVRCTGNSGINLSNF